MLHSAASPPPAPLGVDHAIADQIVVGGLARVHRPTSEELEHEYVAKNRPVIISGAMDDWPALQRWTPAYLAKLMGDLDIHANVQDLDDTLILGRVGSFEAMKLARLVELIESQRDSQREPRRAYYLRAYQFHKLLERWPQLADDIRFPELVGNWADLQQRPLPLRRSGNPVRDGILGLTRWMLTRGAGAPRTPMQRTQRVAGVFFFGGKGTITPLHTDGMFTGAYLCQVYGRKRCFMISPDQDAAVYPRPFRRQFGMSLVDYRKPDFTVHPRFRSARLLEGVLEPGDVLFTPGGWWHAIESLDISISYSHQIINEGNALGWLVAQPERYAARLYYLLQGGLRHVIGAKDWDD
jgi:hypothetical protein